MGRAVSQSSLFGTAQDTSNRPSTSTAASAGNAATPTVERACLPLSPKTATMRSEAPFITFGPSVKPAPRSDEPPKPYHPFHLVEIAERGPDLRQQIDRADARCLLAVFDGNVA